MLLDMRSITPVYELSVYREWEKTQSHKTLLANKIIKGGKGVWGEIPMPASANVSPEEAKRLATWVLATK